MADIHWQVYRMSEYEALAGVQACMMYLIMCIIDYSPENERHGQALLQALYASSSPPCLDHGLIGFRISAWLSKSIVEVVSISVKFPIRVPAGKIGYLPNPDGGTYDLVLS
jgi:hypothetical protein